MAINPSSPSSKFEYNYLNTNMNCPHTIEINHVCAFLTFNLFFVFFKCFNLMFQIPYELQANDSGHSFEGVFSLGLITRSAIIYYY